MKQVLWCALFFCIGQVQAMHILGGYMSYSCEAVPNSGMVKINVQMTVYRDCFGGGAPFDNPAQLAVYKAGVLYLTRSVVQPLISQVTEINPLCPGQPSGLCIEKGVYTTSFHVPDTSTLSYTVVYQRCCRTVTFYNLLNPDDQGHTLSVDITPAALQVLNRAPQWPTPVFATCNHLPAELDMSATDSDGDLLIYSFVSPLQGGGPILSPAMELFSCAGANPQPPCAPPFDSVVFRTPDFGSAFPLGQTHSGDLNPSTGLWSFTPALLGHFGYGILVEEYRNGQQLSRTLHDLSLFVQHDITTTSAEDALHGLHIAPNPAEDVLQMILDGGSGPVLICILDMQGRKWLQAERSAVNGKIEVQTGSFPTGLYVVQVSSGKWTATGRFVR